MAAVGSKWHYRTGPDEERFGLLDKPTSLKYRKQPVYEAPVGKVPKRKLTAVGLTCGIGSMLVGAQELGFRVIGNIEWRDYYRFQSGDRPSTFVQNFPGAFQARGRHDFESDMMPGPYEIDFAAGHPECLPGETLIHTSKGDLPIKSVQVGDLVLTHKGRFKRVVKVFRNKTNPKDTRIVRLFTTKKPGQQKAPHEFITCTANHPLLTARGWVAAEDVRPGDQIFRMHRPCPVCGTATPAFKDFCSVSCAARNQWAESTPEERSRLVEKAHERTRERVAEGVHQFQDPEVRSRAAKVLGASRKGSNLERIMAWTLEKEGLPPPEPQFPVLKYFVDFAYPEQKLAIECDGVYWHDPDKDAIRDAELEAEGWTILRFSEARIRTEARECAREIRRVLDNHSGNYSFEPVEVQEISQYFWKTSKTVYNLTVEDDSSYVAKGFVVHNCGRYSNLSFSVTGGSYQETRGQDVSDIPMFLKMVALYKPRFFLMDDLPASFDAFPMSEYVKLLPEYDLFPEWISNWGYGNIQKYRNRMFIVGALKEEKYAFVPNEAEHSRVLKDDILDLIDIEGRRTPLANHAQVDLKNIPGRYVNMDYYGHRPSWEQIRGSNKDLMKNLTYFTPAGEGKIRPGTRSPDWDGFCPVLSGGFNPLHPIRKLPLTIRERARIQGFKDDFVFNADDEGPYREVWEPYSSDGQRAIKQTGKAMPLQFCTYVAKSVKAHIEGKRLRATNHRVNKPNPLVTQAKRDFCELSGYANPEAVKASCWMDEPVEFYRQKKIKKS